MHSRATDRKECVQMPGKIARSDPRPSVRVTRGAGSGQHVASVLQEGRENANIDAGLGFDKHPGRNGRQNRRYGRSRVDQTELCHGSEQTKFNNSESALFRSPTARAFQTEGARV